MINGYMNDKRYIPSLVILNPGSVRLFLPRHRTKFRRKSISTSVFEEKQVVQLQIGTMNIMSPFDNVPSLVFLYKTGYLNSFLF